MDDLLPATLYDFTVCSFMVAGGTLIVFVANPWVVIRSELSGRVAITVPVLNVMNCQLQIVYDFWEDRFKSPRNTSPNI